MVLVLLAGCVTSQAQSASTQSIPTTVDNPAAAIPAMCWTDPAGTHNPCYVCHRAGTPPNFNDDSELQAAWDFPAPALENPWSNLWVQPDLSAWTDDEILAWVRTDNLSTLSVQGWDGDNQPGWSGYTPGDDADWMPLRYTPLPGAFWPTNGSFDDVFIRLPPELRGDAYAHNLALTEALVLQRDVPLETPLAEISVDLDGDGVLGTATRVAFRWPGLAYEGGQGAAPGLFPVGTEFLHSVRYLDVVDGQVVAAARVKELRYMRKERALGWLAHEQLALSEGKERDEQPDAVRRPLGNPETGLLTPSGWRISGFIEAADGTLRPQTTEETLWCVGCHSGVVGGATDSTWAYARKVPGVHDQDLRGLAEPARPDGAGEYATYLTRVGAGDELRANTELIARFLDQPGPSYADDISVLVIPSPQRALDLNRAYRHIVVAQSYALGRQGLLEPAVHVRERVDQGEATGLTPVQ